MKLKIHYPRILLALLMMIGAITATAVLSAEQGREPEAHPVLLTKAPTKPPLAEVQKVEAVEIVRKSGIVEKFNGNQAWIPVRLGRANLPHSWGVAFEAEWEEPADHSGPWSILQCSYTRRVAGKVDWNGFTVLALTVDTTNEAVVGYAAMDDSKDEATPVMGTAHLDAVVKVYDMESGELLIEERARDLYPPYMNCALPGLYIGTEIGTSKSAAPVNEGVI